VEIVLFLVGELQDKAIKLVNAFRQCKLDTMSSTVKTNLVTGGSTFFCHRMYAHSKAFGQRRDLYSCLRAEVISIFVTVTRGDFHMKRLHSRALGALVLFIFAMSATGQDAGNSASQITALEQQVQTYLQQQKPQLAIPLLRQIVSLDPKNLNAQANLGVLIYFQGDFAGAIPEMRTALQIQPNLPRIRALLGIAEKRTGDMASAESDLEQAFPSLDDPKLMKQVGLELIEIDASASQFAKALAISAKLEEVAPQDPQILFVAYEIATQLKDQTMLNMVLVSPESAEMNMMVAGELARQGEHDKSIAKYREALRLNPHLPGVHFELAEQLRAAADPKLNALAEGEYKAAVKENQYDQKSWCHLGEVIAARGDFKAAQEAYNKALALQPEDSTAKTGLAIALISMNQQKEAIPLLESAIRNDPTNIVAHYRLSGLYRRAGRVAEAKHEMDQYTHYKGLKDKMGEVLKQVSAQTTPN
jgi:cytochrome c-type biogenesis protein CcmH/NrfG